jgi:HD-GYP domain-containing protein (c-di-GMP phosphodiesterase class II)
MPADDATTILAAARVHDIGKIGLPDTVLMKEGPLTEDEYQVMQTHSKKGADLLAGYPHLEGVARIVLHHHERWDGQGYPHGLAGQHIPLGSRIIAVADSFDAMTSNRPYRAAMQKSAAIDILLRGSGEQWDPVVVQAFIAGNAPQQRKQAPARQSLVVNSLIQ